MEERENFGNTTFESLQNVSFNDMMIKLVSTGLHYMSWDEINDAIVYKIPSEYEL